jgi:hypothetical protein
MRWKIRMQDPDLALSPIAENSGSRRIRVCARAIVLARQLLNSLDRESRNLP